MKHRKNRITFWRRERERQEILAAARRREADEAQAAIARMLSQPTAGMSVVSMRAAPLLTPGRAARAPKS